MGGLITIIGTGYVMVSVRKVHISCEGVLDRESWMTLPSTVVKKLSIIKHGIYLLGQIEDKNRTQKRTRRQNRYSFSDSSLLKISALPQ